MKLSLPLLVFAAFATADVVADKKKVMLDNDKLRGNKNVLLSQQGGRVLVKSNQGSKLDAVPSSVDAVTTKIVGGNEADNGEYPYFGESSSMYRESANKAEMANIIFLTFQCFAIQSVLGWVWWYLDLSYYCVDFSSLLRNYSYQSGYWRLRDDQARRGLLLDRNQESCGENRTY
jgi:hypothetical protein